MNLLERRREMMKGDKWEKIKTVVLGGDVITPIAYDATTDLYEVASFPSWVTAEAGTAFFAAVVALDLSNAGVLPVPVGNNSSAILIAKTDDTHFQITQGAPTAVDVTKWRLANYSGVARAEILTNAEYQALRGLNLRMVIENTNTLISKYHNIVINGNIGHSQGAQVYTTDCNNLDYHFQRKYLGYIDFEFSFNAESTSVTIKKIAQQWCMYLQDNTIVKDEHTGLEGETTGSLWGYGNNRGICIGGFGVSRPDCTVHLYKERT